MAEHTGDLAGTGQPVDDARYARYAGTPGGPILPAPIRYTSTAAVPPNHITHCTCCGALKGNCVCFGGLFSTPDGGQRSVVCTPADHGRTGYGFPAVEGEVERLRDVARSAARLANDLMDFALDWPEPLWTEIAELRRIAEKEVMPSDRGT